MSARCRTHPASPGPGWSGSPSTAQPYVVKYLDRATDWTLRASGVLGGPVVALWTRGLLDRLPDCINQPIVAVARGPGRPDQRTAS